MVDASTVYMYIIQVSLYCVVILSLSPPSCRIIVGAPSGTFPGGLSYEDLGAPRAERSGLVYTCPIQPGTCDGVRGDTTRYLGVPDALDNDASLVLDQNVGNYPQSYIEGRLFDQARKPFCIFVLNLLYNSNILLACIYLGGG